MILHLNSDFLSSWVKYLWAAALTVTRFLNPAGSSLNSAGLSCFLLANLRKLGNVRLLEVTQHLDEEKKVCPLQ